jgi:hypothetical protein
MTTTKNNWELQWGFQSHKKTLPFMTTKVAIHVGNSMELISYHLIYTSDIWKKIKEMTRELLWPVLAAAMLSSFFCLPGAGPSSISVPEFSLALANDWSKKWCFCYTKCNYTVKVHAVSSCNVTCVWAPETYQYQGDHSLYIAKIYKLISEVSQERVLCRVGRH